MFVSPLFFLTFLAFEVNARQDKRLKRDSEAESVCYGYGAYSKSSYEVSIREDDGLVTLKCCSISSFWIVSRWLKLEDGKKKSISSCHNGQIGDSVACCKYQSRDIALLLLNAAKLSQANRTTFLCGKDRYSSSEFYALTKLHLKVSQRSLNISVRPADENCSVVPSEESSPSKSVTCISDLEGLHWKVGSTPVRKCTENRRNVPACYNKMRGGVELKVFSQERKLKKKFKCLGRKKGSNNNVKSRVCSSKVQWNYS